MRVKKGSLEGKQEGQKGARRGERAGQNWILLPKAHGRETNGA